MRARAAAYPLWKRGNEMDQTIAFSGGDARMRLLAQMMAAEGYDVCSWELTGAPNKRALCDALKADIIVLPLPAEKKRLFERHRAHDGEPAALAAARAPHFRGQCGKRRVNACAVVGAYDHGLLCPEELSVRNAIPTAEGGHRGGDEAHECHAARHAMPRARLWPHWKGARARSERAGSEGQRQRAQAVGPCVDRRVRLRAAAHEPPLRHAGGIPRGVQHRAASGIGRSAPCRAAAGLPAHRACERERL